MKQLLTPLNELRALSSLEFITSLICLDFSKQWEFQDFNRPTNAFETLMQYLNKIHYTRKKILILCSNNNKQQVYELSTILE